MEKPIARSQAEASTLVQTARQAQKRLFVAEQSAYQPSNEILVELLASGEVGEIVMWDCIRHYAVDPDTAHGALRYDSTPWRKEGDFPLGAMFDGGIHLIAMLSSVFGQPDAVTASGRKLREGYGEYDHVITFLQYANGLTGVLSFSQWMPPMQSHFHIHGASGIVVVESDRLVVQKKDVLEHIIPLPGGDGRSAMWRAFADAFQGGREPRYTPEQAMRDVALLEATSQSIKCKQRMML
jgi:predicted dehydrogenase